MTLQSRCWGCWSCWAAGAAAHAGAAGSHCHALALLAASSRQRATCWPRTQAMKGAPGQQRKQAWHNFLAPSLARPHSKQHPAPVRPSHRSFPWAAQHLHTGIKSRAPVGQGAEQEG